MSVSDSQAKNPSLNGLEDFWAAFDRLVANSRIVIDRPKGSHHPRYPDIIYPSDYGYLAGTASMDGGGIDIWVGSLVERKLEAVIFTVDLNKRDSEVKLLLGCTRQETQEILKLLNEKSMRAILVQRHGAGRSLLRTRRSVRRFSPERVPDEALEQVLEAATWAPSAHNRQPWRFVVLTTVDAKTSLADAMGAEFRRDLQADGLSDDDVEAQVQRSRQRIQEAPVVIMLCLDTQVGDDYPDERRRQAEYLMGVQSVAMAGENLLLAAHDEGLGGVWVCAPLFAQESVRKALELPIEWQPQGLLLLGYPAKVPQMRPHRPIAEITRFL
jgi:coenzyme F420-0:L-glutamate ligase/coenzyme F420-1:gamma-L-glutamate ligase